MLEMLRRFVRKAFSFWTLSRVLMLDRMAAVAALLSGLGCCGRAGWMGIGPGFTFKRRRSVSRLKLGFEGVVNVSGR